MDDEDETMDELERYADEDLVEELIRRNSKFSDSQLRSETARMLKEHRTAEAAYEEVESRVNEAVAPVLAAVEDSAKKFGVMLAVREELLDQTDQDQEENGSDE